MRRSANWWSSAIFCRRPSVDERRSEAVDDRPGASAPVDRAAVRVGLHQPLGVLLRADWRDAAEPGADAADRRAVPGDAVLWRPSDGAASAAPGLCRRSQTNEPPDGEDGPGGDLPEAP